MNKKFYRFFTYACLLFIGAGVLSRFLLLGNGYEYDELFTAITADPSLSLGWIWTNWLMVDVHPPLYNIVMWVYNHFVPYGPKLWMRLPSVVFGIVGMVIAWVMFPKRYGKTAKLIFMAFLSCNFWFVFYTQHARAYAMLLCIAMPFNYLFINMALLVRKGKKIAWKTWAWYGVLGLLMCWTHYFGAMAFGFFSLVLLGYAFKYKRNLWPFIVVPAVVTLLFLPWAVPNLLYNAGDRKFSGNWWANGYPITAAWWNLVEFYFEDILTFGVVSMLFTVCLWKRTQLHKQGKPNPYIRDIGLFSLVGLLMIGFVSLISLKMYVAIGRYFLPIMPAILLAFSLTIAPYVRKSKGLMIWMFIGLCMLVEMGVWLSMSTTNRLYDGIEAAMEYYKTEAPEKELFVVVIEGYPAVTTQAMYSFYPKHVLKMKNKVTALTRLPREERNEVLKRKDDALIWMPHCAIGKLRSISLVWQRAIGVELELGTSCFLRFAEEGQMEAPPEWGNPKNVRIFLEEKEDGTRDYPKFWKEIEKQAKTGRDITNEFDL